MNILRVISSMNPEHGGPCQGIRNIVPALEALGVHNEVVSLDDPKALFLGKDSFPIHGIGPWKGSWKSSRNLVPWLMKNLARFDAVIVHGLWLYHGYAVQKAFQALKKNLLEGDRTPKLFVMPHGMLDPYFQRAPERKIKAIRNWLYWKAVESRLVNTADGILFTCEEELLLARQTFAPYRPKHELNVSYGIETPPAYTSSMRESFSKKCPSLRGHPYLLFLSRVHEKKGTDLLLRAFIERRKMQTQIDNFSSPFLVIAGPGMDTPYGKSLQLLVEENGMNDVIFFPGMLSGDAKWGAFHGCEAFTLPSHQENFGISVAEALACGKPVLISNQVNIWKEIKAGGGGIIQDDTLTGTTELLKQWMSFSSGQKISMSKHAEDTFKQNFAIGPAALRFVKEIDSVVSEFKNSAIEA